MKFVIRKATRADMPALLAIEQEAFPHSHWSAEDLVSNDCHVAAVGHEIAGFLVSKQVFAGDADSLPEREILNVAVKPVFRRLGVALALLHRELTGEGTYFLEVRASNVAAQALYRRCGFEEVARRAGYYQFPVESAIVMRMK